MTPAGGCGKCGGLDVIRVPGLLPRDPGPHSIRLGATGGRVPVTRFVCGGCGYVEEWVESAADREKLRRRYGGGCRFPAEPEARPPGPSVSPRPAMPGGVP